MNFLKQWTPEEIYERSQHVDTVAEVKRLCRPIIRNVPGHINAFWRKRKELPPMIEWELRRDAPSGVQIWYCGGGYFLVHDPEQCDTIYKMIL